jgi:hypothetical protein
MNNDPQNTTYKTKDLNYTNLKTDLTKVATYHLVISITICNTQDYTITVLITTIITAIFRILIIVDVPINHQMFL